MTRPPASPAAGRRSAGSRDRATSDGARPRPREDGLLVERAVDGRTSVWGEVLAREPPHRLVLTWHPGGDPDDASEVEVRFTASEGGGTRVELEHRGWERFGESAMLRRHAYVGPGAWGHVLDHFASVATLARTPRPHGGRGRVRRLLRRGRAWRLRRAAAGEWDAPVLAHVALNDLAMTAVAHALVHGRTDLAFGNTTCQDPQVLTDWVASTGDLTALVAAAGGWRRVDGRHGRLDPDQLATAVPCRLFHDGALVLDDAMPWARLAPATQDSVHLPAHTGQLRDLRR